MDSPVVVAAEQAMVPDVLAICSEPDDDVTEVRDAELVIEVLSPGNRAREMAAKLEAYLTLPSLAAYFVVDGDMYEAWTPIPGGPWQREEVKAGAFKAELHGRTVTL